MFAAAWQKTTETVRFVGELPLIPRSLNKKEERRRRLVERLMGRNTREKL